MKLSLETASANMIHSYETGAIKIQQYSDQSNDSDPAQANLLTLTRHFIVTPDQIIEDWITNAPTVSIHDMQRVIETQPEVILLGTGETLAFPGNDVMQLCYQRKIGIEVMSTAAACRTYNILASEYRKVAAAMLLDGQ